MKLTPIAAISGARRGAFRNFRYATASIPAFSNPENTIEAIRVRIRTPTIRNAEDSLVTPVATAIVAAKNAPIMNTSPCAKLINSMIP
jgi:hypothetical protein